MRRRAEQDVLDLDSSAPEARGLLRESGSSRRESAPARVGLDACSETSRCCARSAATGAAALDTKPDRTARGQLLHHQVAAQGGRTLPAMRSSATRCRSAPWKLPSTLERRYDIVSRQGFVGHGQVFAPRHHPAALKIIPSSTSRRIAGESTARRRSSAQHPRRRPASGAAPRKTPPPRSSARDLAIRRRAHHPL